MEQVVSVVPLALPNLLYPHHQQVVAGPRRY
jgi:hypothetical protein